jgi:hypothetical protein
MLTASKLLAFLTALLVMVLLALVIVVPRGEAESPDPRNPSIATLDSTSTAGRRTDASDPEGVATPYGYYAEEVLRVASTIPTSLQPALKDTDFVNGCHPWTTKELGSCAFGTFDPAGWDSDDTHGHDWANTIWISSQAVRTGKVPDVVLHEVGHAVVHNLFGNCYFPKQAEMSVKELLLLTFAHGDADPAELLADAFVVAFSTHSDDLHTYYLDESNYEVSREVILTLRAAVWLCSK